MNWLYRQRWIVVLLFMLLVSLVIVSGYNLNKRDQEEIQNNVKVELQTIAELKIEEIAQWYKDQMEDSRIIAQNVNLVRNIEQWLKTADAQSERDLLNRFGYLLDQHSLTEILLISTDYRPLISSHYDLLEIDPIVKQTAENCLKSDHTQCTDLYYCKGHNAIHIDFVAPLINDTGELLCFIVYVLNASEFLYPYLQKWPIPSKSAETLILRADQDSVLFLNELRHLRDTALKLRIPLTEIDVPAVMAVRGYSGVMWGTDYRNNEVLAYVDRISGTPWYFVAKMDREEVYDQPFLVKNIFIIVTGVFILVLFLVAAFVFSQAQKNSYKSQYLAQQEFRTILYSIGDAVIITNNDGLIKNLNSAAELVTGWTELEAVNQPLEKVFNVANGKKGEKIIGSGQTNPEVNQAEDPAEYVILQTKDGRSIPVVHNEAPIHNNKGEAIGSIIVIRDQSAELENRSLLEEQRRQLYTLMSNLPGIAYRCLNDQEWTMEFLSKGCMELTGYNDDELINNNSVSYAKIIAEEFREMVWKKVQIACRNKETFELEYQIVTKNGLRKWVWEKGQGVYNEKGELLAIEGFISDIDRRKKFEAALSESEHHFQMITENSTVGIFKTDAHGNTIYVNPKWCEIAGLSPEMALGKGWISQVHSDDRKQLQDDWNKKILTGEPSVAEYRFVYDNTIIYVKGQAVPEFNENGQLTGYMGTITDVSDIKNVEEQLKSSNLLLRTLIDNIPDAIYLKDLEGRKIIANKADINNIGAKSEEEIIGKNDFDVFPKEIAKQFHDTDQEVLQSGKPVLYHEEELVNEKNEVKWLSTSKIPYRDAKGNIVGLIGIGHDLTQRKKDEDERIKLLTVLKQSPVSIVITDTSGKIEYVNPKFTEETGYTYEEAIGRKPNMLKSGYHPEEFYQNMWRTISSGKEFDCEILNRKKSGETYWENAIIAPIKNKYGEIINYMAVKEDITDKKNLMSQLIKAKERAEESEQLKTSFLANMSHEIRTPLNSILGFTNILVDSEGLSDSEKDEYMSIIDKSSASLLQIINDIIDISSLETRQMKMVFSSFIVNDTISKLYREFVKKIDELKNEDLELRMINTREQIEMYTDQNRLNQIFINLLTNALKFTSSGYIEFGIDKFDEEFVYFNRNIASH